MRVARSDLNPDLKTGGRTDDGIRNRARNLLIVSEIALSLILLVCAGLLLQSFETFAKRQPWLRSRANARSPAFVAVREILERAGG